MAPKAKAGIFPAFHLFLLHHLVQRLKAFIHLLVYAVIQLIITLVILRMWYEGIPDMGHLPDGSRKIRMESAANCGINCSAKP